MKKIFLIGTTVLCGSLAPLSAAMEMIATHSCLTAKSYTNDEIFIAPHDGEVGSYLYSLNGKNKIRAYSLAEKIYDVNGNEFPNPVHDSPINQMATYEHGLLFSTQKEPHRCYVVTPFKGKLILDRFIDISSFKSQSPCIVSINAAGPEMILIVDMGDGKRDYFFVLLNKGAVKVEEMVAIKNDDGETEQVLQAVEKRVINFETIQKESLLSQHALDNSFATFLPLATAQKGSTEGARKSLEPLCIAHKAPIAAPTSSIFTCNSCFSLGREST